MAPDFSSSRFERELTMQKNYEWLWKEPGPMMLVEMRNLTGTLEARGTRNNPTIIGWAKETGVGGYKRDSVPWCGLAMAIAAKRANWPHKPGGNALWARNWAEWGLPVPVPMLGDVLVFARGKGGHVALYVGEDATHFHIIGGNQMDAVNIVRKAKSALLEARRASWRVAQPENVRRVMLAAKGAPESSRED